MTRESGRGRSGEQLAEVIVEEHAARIDLPADGDELLGLRVESVKPLGVRKWSLPSEPWRRTQTAARRRTAGNPVIGARLPDTEMTFVAVL